MTALLAIALLGWTGGADVPPIEWIDAATGHRVVRLPREALRYRVERGHGSIHFNVSPDGKWIVFESNMHGASHVYAVEVEKPQ